MNACEARGGYEKRGGGVLSVLGPIRKAGGGGGCLPYDDLYISWFVRACVIVRGESGEWSGGGGGRGGGAISPRAYAGSGAEFVIHIASWCLLV